MSSHGPCYTFHFLCLILTTVLRFGTTHIAIICGPYFVYKKDANYIWSKSLFINLNVMKFFITYDVMKFFITLSIRQLSQYKR